MTYDDQKGAWEKFRAKPFPWNAKSIKAAVLVAEDDMNDERIAEAVGTSHYTLGKWKSHPEFKERVALNLEALERAMLRLPIAKKRKRVQQLDDMNRRLMLLVEDREAAYAEDKDVIGGRTGLVVKQTRLLGTGKDARIVEEFAFDRPVVMELRATQEQAAKELGQWVDKGEITGANGSPLIITEIVIDRSNAAPESDEDEGDEE